MRTCGGIQWEWRIGAHSTVEAIAGIFPFPRALYRSTMVMTRHPRSKMLFPCAGEPQASRSIMYTTPTIRSERFSFHFSGATAASCTQGFVLQNGQRSSSRRIPLATIIDHYLGIDMLFDPWPHGWCSLPISAGLALHHFSPTPPFSITADTMTFVLAFERRKRPWYRSLN